jgi:hypothetical protein
LERLPVHLLTIALSQASGRLEILELNNVNLTGSTEEFRDFMALLRQHASLRVFCLSSSGCSSACSITDLMGALSDAPRLEKVIIYSEGRSPWGPMTGEAVGTLCRSATITELQHLVLYNSSSALGQNFFTDEHTVSLAQALSGPADSIGSSTIIQPSLSQMQEIMISCWPLGIEGVRALCQMLRVNTSLRKMTFVIYELEEIKDGCIIVDIAEALKFNQSLKVLELHGRNNDSDAKIAIEAAFLDMLQTNNYALTRLKLFNDEHSFIKPDIDFYLKLNQAGRGDLLQNANATKSEWIQALANVRHDLSCLYYFLSTNPLIMEG